MPSALRRPRKLAARTARRRTPRITCGHEPDALTDSRQSLRSRHRKLSATEPLYVICRSRVLAGLASGILKGAGCANAIVVDGGMETWQAQGLPVVRKKWFAKIAIDAPMLPLVAGFGFGLGLAVHEVFFVLPLIVGF